MPWSCQAKWDTLPLLPAGLVATGNLMSGLQAHLGLPCLY